MNPLISRAKARDPEALTEIYQHYYTGVYHYLYRRLGDADLAEDMAADVFVRMLEGIDRYEDRGWSISAWLYRIAHDRSIDLIRKQTRRPTVSIEPWHAIMSGPEESVIRAMEYDELWSMLDSLTIDQRNVLELRFWGEQDICATAMTLGKTQGAVKTLQHRAVGMLNRRIMASAVQERQGA